MLLPPQPVPDAPAVGLKIAQILERARRSGAMVIHVRNNGGRDDPDAPGTTGWEMIHRETSLAALQQAMSRWCREHTPPTATGSAPRRK